MPKPIAKEGDHVCGVDTHVVLVPSPAGPVPTPTPMPFDGVVALDLCERVLVEGAKAAVAGSRAQNLPLHVPAGGPFQRPPSNQATIAAGGSRVLIGGKPAARAGDTAVTCSDPADAPNGVVVASGRVLGG